MTKPLENQGFHRKKQAEGEGHPWNNSSLGCSDGIKGGSGFSVLQTIDQPRQHSGNLLQTINHFAVNLVADQISSPRQFQQRDAFLNRSSSDPKEILAIRLGKAAVALSKVCGDGKCGPIELIGKEAITPSEILRELADSVSEVDGLLIDNQFLKGEGHKQRVESRE